LDCKEDRCQSVAAVAPQIVDYLCDECKNHFIKVLEYLDGLAMPYTLNPRVVRGLDYYTKTIFEVWPASSPTEEAREKPGSQSALGGGGRYDGLIENLGGTPTPACGLAFGIERIITEIKKQNVRVSPREKPPQIFLSQLGEAARKKALKLFEDLRAAGVKVAEALAKGSLKTQLEIANKLKVKFTLILGQKEVLDKTIILRDMTTGNQETIDFDKVIKEIKKRL
jgi:histidyl-tRNA synthetase